LKLEKSLAGVNLAEKKSVLCSQMQTAILGPG
jgi:hypothetical protein